MLNLVFEFICNAVNKRVRSFVRAKWRRDVGVYLLFSAMSTDAGGQVETWCIDTLLFRVFSFVVFFLFVSCTTARP